MGDGRPFEQWLLDMGTESGMEIRKDETFPFLRPGILIKVDKTSLFRASGMYLFVDCLLGDEFTTNGWMEGREAMNHASIAGVFFCLFCSATLFSGGRGTYLLTLSERQTDVCVKRTQPLSFSLDAVLAMTFGAGMGL
jgi:hypothetical protein